MNMVASMFRDISELSPPPPSAAARQTQIPAAEAKLLVECGGCHDDAAAATASEPSPHAVAAAQDEAEASASTQQTDAVEVNRPEVPGLSQEQPFTWHPVAVPAVRSRGRYRAMVALCIVSGVAAAGATAMREPTSATPGRLHHWSRPLTLAAHSAPPGKIDRKPVAAPSETQVTPTTVVHDRIHSLPRATPVPPSDDPVPPKILLHSRPNPAAVVVAAANMNLSDLGTTVSSVRDLMPSEGTGPDAKSRPAIAANDAVIRPPATTPRVADPLPAPPPGLDRPADVARPTKNPGGSGTFEMTSPSPAVGQPSRPAAAIRPRPQPPASTTHPQSPRTAAAIRGKPAAETKFGRQNRYGLGRLDEVRPAVQAGSGGATWLASLPAPSHHPDWARKAFEGRD